MKINRSLGEAEGQCERRPLSKDHKKMPQTSKKLKMQKACSFNNDKNKHNIGNGLSFKIKSDSYNLDDSFQAYKNQNTNRTESNSKDGSPAKKTKVKIKRK